MGFIGVLVSDSLHSGAVNIPPQLGNVGVGLSPGSHQGRQFLFRQAHFQSTHCFQRPYRATIAKGQFGNFAFLTEVTVDAVLFHRNAEHLRCRRAVDVLALGKDLLPPSLPGKPCNDPGFNGREVGNDEFPAVLRDKCCADQLG